MKPVNEQKYDGENVDGYRYIIAHFKNGGVQFFTEIFECDTSAWTLAASRGLDWCNVFAIPYCEILKPEYEEIPFLMELVNEINAEKMPLWRIIAPDQIRIGDTRKFQPSHGGKPQYRIIEAIQGNLVAYKKENGMLAWVYREHKQVTYGRKS